MIQIDLKLFVTLSPYHPDPGNMIKVPDGTRVGDLIDQLKIPADTVKLIFINGTKADADAVLKENDRLGLFPPVGGG